MRTYLLILSIISLLLFSNVYAQTSSTAIIADHQSVEEFSQIPDNVVTSAASLRLMLRHASVGSNINGGLDALYIQDHKYNRSNWSFQSRGNPGWQPKVDDLVTQTALQWSIRDVLTMKLCYIDNNVDPNTEWAYYRDHMEQLISAYPAKTFVWWTMPIMTSGDTNRDAFNNLVRAYAQTHNIVLFDIAAIESHDPQGNAITQNSREALYSGYTTDGGHLNALGAERVAQALWVLMARISGWGAPDSASQYDWPTLAHDMKRSGSTTVGPDGPYTKVWFRDFWSELGEQVGTEYQPVIVRDQVNNKDIVYIGTASGAMYALNLDDGEIIWRYPAPGQFIGGILASPTVEDNIVYVGSLDGKFYALDGGAAPQGAASVKWIYDTGRIGGFLTTPVVTNDSVYIGGRDGYFYALDKQTGQRRWEVNIGAPILTSSAFENNIFYFGAENMRAYAYSASGQRIWESGVLAGQSLRGNYPVISNDKVIFRTTPADDINILLNEGERLLAYAAGCTDYPYSGWWLDRKVIPCFQWKPIVNQANQTQEQDAIRAYLRGDGYTASDGKTLNGRRQYETFHVLDKATGQKPYIAPVLWTAGNGQLGVPPVAGPDGRLWALYRSYYSNFDSDNTWYIMTGFGQMDTVSGNISIRNPKPDPDLQRDGYLCDQYSCNPPFSTNIWMIGDETTSFSVAGNKIYTNQWSGSGTINLDDGALQSIVGRRDGFVNYLIDDRARVLPFSHPPQVGNNDIPYGPPIFGDKIIYNYGSVVVMIKGRLPGANPDPVSPIPPHQVRSVSATTAGAVSIPVQSELEKYIWQAPQLTNIDQKSSDLKNILETQINDFLNTGRFTPWFFEPGKVVMKGYFLEPAETAYYLALAYPYISDTLKARVRNFVNTEWDTANPDLNPIAPYWADKRYDWLEGLNYNSGLVTQDLAKARQPFAPGPIFHCYIKGGTEANPCEGFIWGAQTGYLPVRRSFHVLYDLWFYAYRTGDWAWIENHWNQIRDTKLDRSIDINNDESLLDINMDPTGANRQWPERSWSAFDSANRRVLALIAYARIAEHMNKVSSSSSNQAEISWAVDAASRALQARLKYVNIFRPHDGDNVNAWSSNWDDGYNAATNTNFRGVFIQRFGAMDYNIPQYRELRPEVSRLLADYAREDFARYEHFIDITKQSAYLQRGGNAFGASEIMYTIPIEIQGIFLAKALVAKHDGDYLKKYLDIPWVKQDYFYWERLARTIEAYGVTSWCDVRNGSCAVTPPLLTGDINNDTQVNVLDVQACVNHILGIQNLGNSADVNQDGSVDVLDVQVIVNIILGV